jgi:hypothetical protein
MNTSSTEVPAAITAAELIHKFLSPHKGKSSDDVKARIIKWAKVEKNPEDYITKQDDKGPSAIAARRKTARQNLRLLIERNPEIAAELDPREVV